MSYCERCGARVAQSGEEIVRTDCLIGQAIARMGSNEAKWPAGLPRLRPGEVAEWITPVGTFLVHVKARDEAS